MYCSDGVFQGCFGTVLQLCFKVCSKVYLKQICSVSKECFKGVVHCSTRSAVVTQFIRSSLHPCVPKDFL